jgi:hypothetical protein
MIPHKLHEWAIRHGVNINALHELNMMLGTVEDEYLPEIPERIQTETDVQSMLRINIGKVGGRLWRNNRGAGYLEDGSFIRWGLANDTTHMNEVIKSHDLIGIKPVLISPDMVGSVIGQFWSREAKPPGWRYTGTPRETAQAAWSDLITSLGGDARFACRGDET